MRRNTKKKPKYSHVFCSRRRQLWRLPPSLTNNMLPRNLWTMTTKPTVRHLSNNKIDHILLFLFVPFESAVLHKHSSHWPLTTASPQQSPPATIPVTFNSIKFNSIITISVSSPIWNTSMYLQSLAAAKRKKKQMMLLAVRWKRNELTSWIGNVSRIITAAFLAIWILLVIVVAFRDIGLLRDERTTYFDPGGEIKKKFFTYNVVAVAVSQKIK